MVFIRVTVVWIVQVSDSASPPLGDAMQYSGSQVLSFLLLLVGTAAVVASIATNYWSQHERQLLSAKVYTYRGLWRSCHKSDTNWAVFRTNTYECTNRFQLTLERANNEGDTSIDFSHNDMESE